MYMKKCLFLMAFLCCSIAWAQNENYGKRKDGCLILTNVETVAGNPSSSELYRRALLWVAEAFDNTSSVIQTQDASAGILVIKGTIPVKGTSTYQHKLTFEFKDGKYRWTISDIYLNYVKSLSWLQKNIEDMSRFSNEDESTNFKNLQDDFTVYISLFKKKISQGDDW